MVTVSESIIRGSHKTRYTFSGKSTDTKPVGEYCGSEIMNGSLFEEMDTGELYFYDAETNSWSVYGGA